MELIPENDSRLMVQCEPYDFASETLESRQDRERLMIEMMVANRGIGLAAPQVGALIRLFVIEVDGATFPCYNPKVVDGSHNMVTDLEGCLSFPDLYFKVERKEWVTGVFQDSYGHEITKTFDGMAARCYQHELDHLDGICFTSKVGPVTLSMARKRRQKQRKRQ